MGYVMSNPTGPGNLLGTSMHAIPIWLHQENTMSLENHLITLEGLQVGLKRILRSKCVLLEDTCTSYVSMLYGQLALCYSLFRSIVLSLLIWTYPRCVSNYSPYYLYYRTILTARIFSHKHVLTFIGLTHYLDT
jgi:hypothetical protein